jgi:hypothetical protein
MGQDGWVATLYDIVCAYFKPAYFIPALVVVVW